MSKDKKNPVLS